MPRTADRIAVGRFRDTNTYFTNADETLLNGSTSMTRLFVVQRIRDKLDGSAAGSQQRLVSNSAIGTNGWAFMVIVSSLEFNCTVGDGGANSLVSPVPLGGELLHVVGFTYDGSTLRSQHHRGDVDTQAAIVSGYSSPTATDDLSVGVRSQSFNRPGIDFAVHGFLSSDAVALSAANLSAAIATVRDNVFHGRDLDSNLSVLTPQHYWDARDWIPGDASWTDRVASVALTRNGRPERFGLQGRF